VINLFEWIIDPYNYPFWILIISIIAVTIFAISRSLSTPIKFIYPNAKFEAIGNPFVGEKGLNHLLDSKNLTTLKDSLNTLKDYNVSGENVYELQLSLDENLNKTIEMMRKDSSKKMNDFYEVYLEKLDSYLIKNELKRKIEGKKTERDTVEDAIFPKTKELLQKLRDAEKKDIPNILKKYGFEQDILESISNENIDILTLDICIDKHVINRFKQVKVPRKCEEAKQRFVNSILDVQNIKNLLRAKQIGYDEATCSKLFLGAGQEIATWKFKELTEAENVSQVILRLEGASYYTPLKDSIEMYNKENSVQILENALDGYFLKIVKELSIQNYTNIGPTIRFIVSKEFEIKNLKIIAKGLAENLSLDFTKSLLTMEAV
jgi:V/A-type H+-transporting ATPase subunit C